LQLVASRERLIGGLAEERRAHAVSARSPGNAAVLARWKNVRSQVERAAGHYAMAIDTYTDAVLSDLAHYLPAGVRGVISGSADGRRAASADIRNGNKVRIPV